MNDPDLFDIVSRFVEKRKLKVKLRRVKAVFKDISGGAIWPGYILVVGYDCVKFVVRTSGFESCINASDPQFFTKLEKYVKEINNAKQDSDFMP